MGEMTAAEKSMTAILTTFQTTYYYTVPFFFLLSLDIYPFISTFQQAGGGHS